MSTSDSIVSFEKHLDISLCTSLKKIYPCCVPNSSKGVPTSGHGCLRIDLQRISLKVAFKMVRRTRKRKDVPKVLFEDHIQLLTGRAFHTTRRPSGGVLRPRKSTSSVLIIQMKTRVPQPALWQKTVGKRLSSVKDSTYSTFHPIWLRIDPGIVFPGNGSDDRTRCAPYVLSCSSLEFASSQWHNYRSASLAI